MPGLKKSTGESIGEYSEGAELPCENTALINMGGKKSPGNDSQGAIEL